jgi:carbon-monoxide dehydrogenase medium subunit
MTPSSLEEALELLDRHRNKARLLAGGTDLLIELRHRLIHPDFIIDLKKIPELQNIRISDKEIKIGSVTPIMEILAIPLVKEEYFALYQSLVDLADEILRYRATVGGNIGTSSPAADSAASLYVLDAQVNITSLSNGQRTVPITQFFSGVKKNVLASDELITSISIPRPISGSKSFFKKMKRSSEDLALVGVACLHNEKKTCVSYTAMAPTPLLVDISDVIFRNHKKLDEIHFKVIWEKIKPKLKPIDDIRASRKYRLHIAEILTRGILKEVVE